MKTLTPAQAAERAGVSRPTVMSAIVSRALKASRDNRNRWQILPDDLENWMQSRGKPDTAATVKPSDTSLEVLKSEFAALTAMLEAKNEVIEVLKAEVAHFRKPFWKRLL